MRVFIACDFKGQKKKNTAYSYNMYMLYYTNET